MGGYGAECQDQAGKKACAPDAWPEAKLPGEAGPDKDVHAQVNQEKDQDEKHGLARIAKI